MKLVRQSRLGGLVCVSCVLAGCGDASQRGGHDVVMRLDSAGIEIVEVAASAEDVPVVATLDSVPLLRLGSMQDPPEAQFGVVSEVQPLADGGFAVLDGQAAQVRIFDASGAFQFALGSRGDGPGEFRSPISLAILPGDTLAVYDNRPMRVTRFGPDGRVSDIATLRDVQSRVVEVAFLPDGGLVGQSRRVAPTGGAPPPQEPTLVRDTAVLTLFDRTGGPVDTIDVVPGQESVQAIYVSPQAISVWKRAAAFGRTNVFAVHALGVWSSTNDRFELRLRAHDGDLLRIVRAPGLERPVTEESAEVIYEQALSDADTPEERRRTDTWYTLSPRPALQPAYDDIVVDDKDRLWIHAWSGVALPTHWWVFEPTGALLGTVRAPYGMQITAAGCGGVWGIERDELGIEYVVKYALRGMPRC